ncbi:MAG: hypothetical protein MI757_15255, partial [Pirellulales bacterium]|nr:hypothetical protein [Pirellulales bacterium]
MTDELRERLWAPWRLDYIRGNVEKDDSVSADGAKPCFLCEAVAAEEDRARLVVARGQRVFAILNRYP